VSPLEIPPGILPETAGRASMAVTPKQADKPMNNPKQKYTIYRDNDLIASDLRSLPSIMKFVRNDALKEHSQGRPAFYMISGSLGFKRAGSHLKGRMVWDG
jgi:hypothetical protein